MLIASVTALSEGGAPAGYQRDEAQEVVASSGGRERHNAGPVAVRPSHQTAEARVMATPVRARLSLQPLHAPRGASLLLIILRHFAAFLPAFALALGGGCVPIATSRKLRNDAVDIDGRGGGGQIDWPVRATNLVLARTC